MTKPTQSTQDIPSTEPEHPGFVPTDPDTCKHPATRLYSAWYYDPELDRDILWIACCDCGTLLKG